MTEKQLKRLNRRQLLELLIEQTDNNEALRKKIAKLEASLAQREILLVNAGSIAEAALRLNHVFEAAQAAADQYLHSVKYLFPEEMPEPAAEDPAEQEQLPEQEQPAEQEQPE